MRERIVVSRYVITGRVQGVGFRYFVAREARSLGLAGWVRNLVDGRVEVLAAGEDSALGVLEGRLWQGPPTAMVIGVATSHGEPPAWSDFRVLPTPW